jgi:hypothetical protein
VSVSFVRRTALSAKVAEKSEKANVSSMHDCNVARVKSTRPRIFPRPSDPREERLTSARPDSPQSIGAISTSGDALCERERPLPDAQATAVQIRPLTDQRWPFPTVHAQQPSLSPAYLPRGDPGMQMLVGCVIAFWIAIGVAVVIFR